MPSCEINFGYMVLATKVYSKKCVSSDAKV